MSGMKLPRSKKVLARKIRQLLEDDRWVKEEIFAQQLATLLHTFPPETIYIHLDGNVLHVFRDGNGRLYEKSDDFRLMLQIVEAVSHEKPRHILAERLPQGQAFIEYIPQLIDELVFLLHLTKEDLDHSVDSLNKVDSAVRKIGFQTCLEVPYFPALVAYVGEVISHATNGKWVMHLSQDGVTWEPWIASPNGAELSPFFVVFKNLDEPIYFSLMGSTKGEIASIGERF